MACLTLQAEEAGLPVSMLRSKQQHCVCFAGLAHAAGMLQPPSAISQLSTIHLQSLLESLDGFLCQGFARRPAIVRPQHSIQKQGRAACPYVGVMPGHGGIYPSTTPNTLCRRRKSAAMIVKCTCAEARGSEQRHGKPPAFRGCARA